MGQEIVFKFRDAVLLKPDHALTSQFRVSDNYYENAAAFIKQAGLDPIDTQPFFGTTLDKRRESPFLSVLNTFISKTGAVPEYLFRAVPPDLPLRLLNAVQRPRRDQYRRFKLTDAGPAPTADGRVSIPNFYNYFTLRLPETQAPTDVAALLADLAAFLPPFIKLPDWASFLVPAAPPHLLDYVYVKNDPVPLGFATPSAASAGAQANQRYFTAMQLKVTTPDLGASVGLSVLEANSWYANHSQFVGQTPADLLNPLTPALSNFTLLDPGGNTNLPDHGTAIMGILRAGSKDPDVPGQPGQDLCRGIVPQATIRLASCLSSLQLGDKDPNHIVAKTYNEAVGLLQLIDRSSRGDVILIEVGAGGEAYPLEVTPAVYDLLRVAYLLELTVVAAAGNKSLYLPGSATDPDPLAVNFRKQVVSLDTAVQLNHSQAFMALYLADQAAIAAELALAQQGVPYVPFANPTDFVAAYLASGTHAILVGAAQEYPTFQTTKGLAQKLPDSSWGPRIKVYAQGQNILTTTYGGPKSPNEFAAIGFTSGAAAVIAGFVTALQSRAKAKGYLIQPDEMASLLTNGTPVVKQINKKGKDQGAYTLPTGGVIPSYAQAAQALDALIAGHAGAARP